MDYFEKRFILKSKNYKFACKIKKHHYVYDIFYGGKSQCMTLKVIKDKSEPYIYLTNISHKDECVLDGRLEVKSGTLEMIKSCLKFLTHYFYRKKSIKWIVLIDKSKTRDYKYSLKELYIAKYGKTWYMKYFDAKPFNIQAMTVDTKKTDDLKKCFDILQQKWNSPNGMKKTTFESFYLQRVADNSPEKFKDSPAYDVFREPNFIKAKPIYESSNNPHEFLMGLDEDTKLLYLHKILYMFKDSYCKGITEKELNWAIDIKLVKTWDDIEFYETEEPVLDSKAFKNFSYLDTANFISKTKLKNII